MKKYLFAVLAFAIISTLFSFKFIGNPLTIGSTLPQANLKMKNINDNMVSMSDAKKANGLLVIFSCNTCPFVIKNQERMNTICNYALQNNIGVIVLNSNEAQRSDDDSFSAMKSYASEQNYKWFYTVDTDNKIADAFGANRTPECFLFNKVMKLAYHGAIDDNPSEPENVTRQHLKEAVTQLVSGADITIKESRSVGCTIKRKG